MIPPDTFPALTITWFAAPGDQPSGGIAAPRGAGMLFLKKHLLGRGIPQRRLVKHKQGAASRGGENRKPGRQRESRWCAWPRCYQGVRACLGAPGGGSGSGSGSGARSFRPQYVAAVGRGMLTRGHERRSGRGHEGPSPARVPPTSWRRPSGSSLSMLQRTPPPARRSQRVIASNFVSRPGRNGPKGERGTGPGGAGIRLAARFCRLVTADHDDSIDIASA